MQKKLLIKHIIINMFDPNNPKYYASNQMPNHYEWSKTLWKHVSEDALTPPVEVTPRIVIHGLSTNLLVKLMAQCHQDC
jgi:hypothetical protein